MDHQIHCPDAEVVERFARGELPARAAREVQAHLEECGLCSVIVERLRELDATEGGMDEAREPDWAPMERRLREECERVYPAPPRQAKRFGWGSRWIPAFGYVLALALVYPAWLGVRQRPAVAQAPVTLPPMEGIAGSGAALVDLNTTRAEKEPPVVAERAGESAAVLTFFVPAAVGARLSVVIGDASGRAVLEFPEVQSSDDQGNYCVVVDPRRLPRGAYRLTAKDRNRPAQPGSSFDFVRR